MNNSPDPKDDKLLNFLKSLKAKVSEVFHEASKIEGRAVLIAGILVAVGTIVTVAVTSNNEKDKSVEDKYSKALELIVSKDNVNSRIAGIETMGELMNKYPDKQWSIVTHLSNLVRENKPHLVCNKLHYEKDSAPSDVKRAILLIKRRDPNKDSKPSNPEKINVDLRRANLHRTDLEYAEFDGTDLSNSDLYGTSLQNAKLNESILRETCLISAGLQNADLTNADLTKANLTDADLTDAKGLSYEQLKKSCYWEKARGIDPEIITRLKEDNNLSANRNKCRR
jgi:Pentapeptide repeats (8 copies)